MFDVLRRAIAAGLLIGLASGLYLTMNASIVAGFLFAFALFFICLLSMDLFTGKIGWFGRDGNSWLYFVIVLLGNLIGTLVISLFLTAAAPGLKEAGIALTEAKMANTWVQLLCKGFLCGIMMYLAVAGFKKGEGTVRWIGIFLAIPVFIFSGFEHSIADAAYMFLGMNLHFLPALCIIILGNALGSIAACWLFETPWKS